MSCPGRARLTMQCAAGHAVTSLTPTHLAPATLHSLTHIQSLKTLKASTSVATQPCRSNWASAYDRGGGGGRPGRSSYVEPPPASSDAEMWWNRLLSLPPSARGAALEQLLRIEEDGAFAGLVSGPPPGADTDGSAEDAKSSSGGGGGNDTGRSSSARLNDRDRRRVTELVSGVSRWRRRLDWVAGHWLRPGQLDTADAPLRQLLRIGVYELLELGLPSHAISEHVELAKRVMHEGCGKVANMVLRRVAEAAAEGRLPRPPPPPAGASEEAVAAAMALASSHPDWMVLRWLTRFGRADTMALLQRNNARPSYSLRVSPAVDVAQLCSSLADGGAEVEPSCLLPSEFVVVRSGLQALLATGLLSRGQAQVQDEAAGLAVAALGPQPGETILDACAAPGGKALFAAARMRGQGRLVAVDISAARLRAVEAAAKGQGMHGVVQCIASDVRAFAERALQAGQRFDRVLLDAPCSGTGVLAKRADLRWRRQPSDLTALCRLQADLLQATCELVKPGGLLVYSTCSLEAEENEGQVAAFLEANPQFRVEAPPTDGGVPGECITEAGFVQTLPHVHATDGAFAARLRRAA